MGESLAVAMGDESSYCLCSAQLMVACGRVYESGLGGGEADCSVYHRGFVAVAGLGLGLGVVEDAVFSQGLADNPPGHRGWGDTLHL